MLEHPPQPRCRVCCRLRRHPSGSALCCNNGTGGNKDTISNLEIAASSNMAKLFGVDSIPADIFSGLYVILDMRTRTASPA